MNTSLTALITAFFTTYLINTAGYSENTVKSYRDTFVLLFLYADEHKLCSRGRINISIFNREISQVSLIGWKAVGMLVFQPETNDWLL